MKLNLRKEWFLNRIPREQDIEISAGIPEDSDAALDDAQCQQEEAIEQHAFGALAEDAAREIQRVVEEMTAKPSEGLLLSQAGAGKKVGSPTKQIQFSEFWKMVNHDLVVDWQDKVVTVRLGPVTIEKVPFPTVKALSSQPAVIEPVLSDLFVTARVMWEREESPKAVQAKLEQLGKMAEQLAGSASTQAPRKRIIYSGRLSGRGPTLANWGLSMSRLPLNWRTTR